MHKCNWCGRPCDGGCYCSTKCYEAARAHDHEKYASLERERKQREQEERQYYQQQQFEQQRQYEEQQRQYIQQQQWQYEQEQRQLEAEQQRAAIQEKTNAINRQAEAIERQNQLIYQQQENERLAREKQERLSKAKEDFESLNKDNYKTVAAAPVVQIINKFCTNCGAKLDSNARFCYECGAKIETTASSKIMNQDDFVLVKGCDWLDDELKSLVSNFSDDDEINDISDFYISKNLVTQKQFQNVTGIVCSRERFLGNSMPVNHINILDALYFCNKLSISEGLEPVYTYRNSTNPDDWGYKPLGIIPESFWNLYDSDYETGSSEDYLKGAGLPEGNKKKLYEVNKKANGYRLPFSYEYFYARYKGSQDPMVLGYNDMADNLPLETPSFIYFKNRFHYRPAGSGTANSLGIYDMDGWPNADEIVDFLNISATPIEEDNKLEIKGKLSMGGRFFGFRIARSKN